jgi:hypothetical protein
MTKITQSYCPSIGDTWGLTWILISSKESHLCAHYVLGIMAIGRTPRSSYMVDGPLPSFDQWQLCNVIGSVGGEILWYLFPRPHESKCFQFSSYIHTYIHTFIHTYIHTYIHSQDKSSLILNSSSSSLWHLLSSPLLSSPEWQLWWSWNWKGRSPPPANGYNGTYLHTAIGMKSQTWVVGGGGSQCFWANSSEKWSFFWLPKNRKVNNNNNNVLQFKSSGI